MILSSHSMLMAQVVLAFLQSMIEERHIGEFYLSPYKNGSEEGWFIASYRTLNCVAFAEDIKQENMIVLYIGLKSDFDNSSLLPYVLPLVLPINESVEKILSHLLAEKSLFTDAVKKMEAD